MMWTTIIAVCLANVIAIRAHICQCDCKSQGLPLQAAHIAAALQHGAFGTASHAERAAQMLAHQQTLASSGSLEMQGRPHIIQHQGPQLLQANVLYRIIHPTNQQVQPQMQMSQQDQANGMPQVMQTGDEKGSQQQPQQMDQSQSQNSLQQSEQQTGGVQINKFSIKQPDRHINVEQHTKLGQKEEGEKTEEELHKKEKDHDAHYKFQYEVNDKKTGDIKSHKEERNGDVVKGEYSLVEQDGNVRTVKYYADWKSGFHAQVQNTKPNAFG